MPPRRTHATSLVLRAIATGYGRGFHIMELTGLSSGPVYPVLRRLESQGYLVSTWEAEDRAHHDGRPRRRLYRLTRHGHDLAARAAERLADTRRLISLGPDVTPAKRGGAGDDGARRRPVPPAPLAPGPGVGGRARACRRTGRRPAPPDRGGSAPSPVGAVDRRGDACGDHGPIGGVAHGRVDEGDPVRPAGPGAQPPFTGVALLLGSVAAAFWIPARRATHVDPVEVLRDE